MLHRRNAHNEARAEWLAALAHDELVAHVDSLLAGPMPDHVLDTMVQSFPRVLARWPDVTISEPRPRSEPKPPKPDTGPLTERQVDVLQAFAAGLRMAEVADGLCISPKTVQHHLGDIFAALDVADRTQAVVRAVQLGLVQIPTLQEVSACNL